MVMVRANGHTRSKGAAKLFIGRNVKICVVQSTHKMILTFTGFLSLDLIKKTLILLDLLSHHQENLEMCVASVNE